MDRIRSAAEVADLLGSWSAGPGALYRKLADALAHEIDEGGLLPGDRLPSERQLAATLAVSRATVVGAYDELRSRDLLESRTGSGTRVTTRTRPAQPDGRVPGGTGDRMFQRLIDGPGSLISLACAAESATPELVEAVEEVARHDLADLFADPGYHPRGLPSLRRAIAEYYTDLGLPTGADQILITTGAHQALMLISEVFLRPGASMALETPGLPACIDVFRAREAQLLPVPLDAEGIDPRELAATLREYTPSLLYVMPTYHNPTGTLMTAARRRQVAELAQRHGVPLLEDNAYAVFAESGDGSELPPLAVFADEDAGTLTVSSLGKIVWAGLRIGWMRGPESIIERCARRKALADLGSPLLDQAVAARLIPRLSELTARRSAELREQCELLERLLREHLPEWRWRTPDGGAALWIELPDVDSHVFAQVALRHGVEVIPGSTMDPTGGHTTHIRVPFTHDKDTLTDMVFRFSRAWKELRRHGPLDEARLRPVI